MPELVSQYIREDREIIYHSENGLLGMGPSPNENEIDLDLINAGKKPVTILPGGSFCHHADSFSMIRGGILTTVCLGQWRFQSKEILQIGQLAKGYQLWVVLWIWWLGLKMYL